MDPHLRSLVLASAAALSLASCTTYVKPTSCTSGATSCGGIHDARFCEYVAERTMGADCAANRLVDEKPFCVVTTSPCTRTSYALGNGDCQVLEYRTLADDDRDECGANVPMFVSR